MSTWTIRYEQGEPVEVIETRHFDDGIEPAIRGYSYRALLGNYVKDNLLEIIRQARTDHAAEFLAAIEEERERRPTALGPLRRDVVCDALDRLAARVKEGKVKKKATDSEIRAFIEAVCPEAPDLYMASFDEATCLRDATNLIRELRVREQAIRVDERAKVLRDIERARGRLVKAEAGIGRMKQALFSVEQFVREALAALPAASEKEGA